MRSITMWYGTNRNHQGKRWQPKGYGPHFSADGTENLRFGEVTFEVDEARLEKALRTWQGNPDSDSCRGIIDVLRKPVKRARIQAYEEKIDARAHDVDQPEAVFGSQRFFANIKAAMDDGNDVVVFIHGYNVDWHEAIITAAALEVTLNQHALATPTKVIPFTWPSDGSMAPFMAYRSDRTEATGSGYAFGRALLKFRDYLRRLRSQVAMKQAQACQCRVNLLCHSMGNFVLQNALQRMAEFQPGPVLPRIFDEIFLCAADVDEDALERDDKLGRLHQVTSRISVYSNRGDLALFTSDFTKGNPDRLGTVGPSERALQTIKKLRHVDCSDIVTGIAEHSYHLMSTPNEDIALCIADRRDDDPARQCVATGDKRAYRFMR